MKTIRLTAAQALVRFLAAPTTPTGGRTASPPLSGPSAITAMAPRWAQRHTPRAPANL
ncbi:MAG: hypothetical protein GKR94_26130 [Gammaproteobacteria bacterium]|nr:hypothetical protein [Gammaproteobacteria bacterium]